MAGEGKSKGIQAWVSKETSKAQVVPSHSQLDMQRHQRTPKLIQLVTSNRVLTEPNRERSKQSTPYSKNWHLTGR